MHDVAKPVSVTPKRKLRGPVAMATGGLVIIMVLLAGIKVMQIGKMMSTPMTMPPTTVSSAVVKEEDWAPILSSVGSISAVQGAVLSTDLAGTVAQVDRKSTRLNSSHANISYAVFCLKKKKTEN